MSFCWHHSRFSPIQSAVAQDLDSKKLLAEPKTYIGSEVCKTCHLEHYDAWKRTLHSKMLQDVSKNEDVIVTEMDQEVMKADFKKIEKKLKVPLDEVYFPKREDVKYTIGSQWKQRYLVKKDGTYYIAPTQFNIDTGRWVNYHDHDWDKRPWLKKCGGCHATGVDLEKETFVEPGVGCEACHGPGSHHAALPATETFEKRATIVNPGKLTGGVAVQICGSCHNRGKSTKVKGAGWPVGYRPGKALETYYKSIRTAADKHLYSNGFSKGHHQQYIDWKNSRHADSGVTCMTCHLVHQLGNPDVPRQDQGARRQALPLLPRAGSPGRCPLGTFLRQLHQLPHAAASPRAPNPATSTATCSPPCCPRTPWRTEIPNSCQTCHKHKDDDLIDLQKRWDALTNRQAAAVDVVQESVSKR